MRVDRIYRTKDEVKARAEEAIDVRFGDYPNAGDYLEGNRRYGVLVEEQHFGYAANSRAEPDFMEAGVELKVTPYVQNKDASYSAKERLVLNIINYMTEAKESFETSSFTKKNMSLMIMFYEHNRSVPNIDWFISDEYLYEFPVEDLLIIRADWERIIGKIRAGLAHELSESDTLYLGACTKGVNVSNTREQPYSDIKAMQRAYCLKQPFMTYLLRNRVLPLRERKNKAKILEDETIIKRPENLAANTFEEYVTSQIVPFIGMSQEDLAERFHISAKRENNGGEIGYSKSVNESIIAKILNIKGHISRTAEFQKAGISVKTIQLAADGKRTTEDMSFPAFRFKELVLENWDESTLKQTFESTRFFFIVFRERKDDFPILEGTFFWNMPQSDLEQVKSVWIRTQRTAKEGIILTPTKRGMSNNLPKSTENLVCHVRPHGRNAEDRDLLPAGVGAESITRQGFWLNRAYIAQIVENWKKQNRS